MVDAGETESRRVDAVGLRIASEEPTPSQTLGRQLAELAACRKIITKINFGMEACCCCYNLMMDVGIKKKKINK